MGNVQKKVYELHRFKMLTGLLTFTALVAGSLNPQGAALGQEAVSVAPTCRVKGHPDAQLTLYCGDGKISGVVQYWHTPFGELQSHTFQSQLDPVFMHHDGSLVIPKSSVIHSGLYYCLLQHMEGTTLWPYELQVDHSLQKNQEHEEYEQRSSCATISFSRDMGEKQGYISNQKFAGAVAASVLLTFVLGFSIGALSRSHILRCLGNITKRLQLSQQQTDTVDSGSEFTMETMPTMSQAFETGNLQEDESVNRASVDITVSSPPTKPQRSFRDKRGEQPETAAYLERCDYKKEQGRKMEEEKAERREEERNNIPLEVKEKEHRQHGASQTETDDKMDVEENDGEQSIKKKEQGEGEEADVKENHSSDNGDQSRGSEVEAGGDKEEKHKDEERSEEEEWRHKKEEDGEKTKGKDINTDSEQSSMDSEDNETDGRTQDDTGKNIISGGGEGGEQLSSPPCPARRSRVIRLYQYDEEGQRYCHLPEPSPVDLGPVPRPRQRTRSLTRLSAIMAAASAGPLDMQEAGREENKDKTHFHIDI